MKSGQALNDYVEVYGSGLYGHIRLQASQEVRRKLSIGAGCTACPGDWNPDLLLGTKGLEARGHDTYQCSRLAIDGEALANNLRVAAENAFPGLVTHHEDGSRAGHSI